MTDEKVFRSKAEELEKLTQEISEIKAAIKEISSAVTRIERHVKRSFGIMSKPKTGRAKKRTTEKGAKAVETPSITPEQALELFDELYTAWDRQNQKLVEAKLQGMDTATLTLVAHELGVSFPTKPSKRSLCSGIIGRLNERAMLSKNVNITPSQKEQMKNKENG